MMMNLTPGNSLRDISGDVRDANGFFDHFPFGVFGRQTPKVDVYETDQEVILKAEIPGVAKEDLNVYIDNDAIRLSGQTRKDDAYQENNVYRTERYYGALSRVIHLPTEVKSEQARAEYKDGILTMTVPKVEPAKLKGHRVIIQ